MKIGFPLRDENTSLVAEGFHGSEWIAIADLFSKETENYSLAELETKTGKDNLFSILSDMEIKTVICKKMQPMALKFFSDNRILVYQAISDDIYKNIEYLKEGKLLRFSANMAEPNRGCGSSCSSSSCSSCNTTTDDIEYL